MIYIKAIQYPLRRMRRLIGNIYNVYKWLPIIWKDKDFDHYFVEVMLYYKLKSMLDFFESKHAVTDWSVPEQAKALQALRICVTILDRRLTEFYILNLSTEATEQFEIIRQCEERDMQVFGKLFSKYLSYWWD